MENCKGKEGFLFLRVLLILFAAVAVSGQAYAHRHNDYDLLVILPYEAGSTNVVRDDEDWVTFGQEFAEYKTASGILADIVTLEDIKANYNGTDEAEQVKRAIYHNVREHGVKYVLLVGDFGVFPVRYQFRGYLAEGDTNYTKSKEDYCEDTCDEDYYQPPTAPTCDFCCVYRQAYRSHAIDAYFANLWDNDDPDQAFETWDKDGDGFYGESYYNNVRGTDGNTLHPDVALGRVPANTPSEYLAYLTKVLIYENRVDASPYRDNILLITADFGSRNWIDGVFGDAPVGYAITYLTDTDNDGNNDIFESEDPNGERDSAAAPAVFVSDYFDAQQPRFVTYDGHGAPANWSEVQFNTVWAQALHNVDLFTNITSSGCSTARFAFEQTGKTLPIAPYNGADQESMAEAFLSQTAGGGVTYIGSVKTTQAWARVMIKRYYDAIVNDGARTAGDAWLTAVEDTILADGLDAITAGSWIDDTCWPDPAVDGYWSLRGLPKPFSVYNMTFFGDPSLRLDGVSNPDDAPPRTWAALESWVNASDLAEASASGIPHEHWVTLYPHDDLTGVLATHYRYRAVANDDRSEMQIGTEFFIPTKLNQNMEGQEGEVRFWSVDRVGNTEPWKTRTFGYDFTPPESEVLYSETETPDIVNGVVLLENQGVQITASDNLSGIARIWTRSPGGREHATYGNRLEYLQGWCAPPRTIELEYRAEDNAGNLEDWQSLTLHWERGSADPKWCNGIPYDKGFQFPPSHKDKRIKFEFRESKETDAPVWTAALEWVEYEYTGPVTTANAPEDWKVIGKAKRKSASRSWQLVWDTESHQILNGWYLVRSVHSVKGVDLAPGQVIQGKPFMLLIDNLPKDSHSLVVERNSPPARPGESLFVEVTFTNAKLGAMKKAVMRLGLDNNFLASPRDTSLIRKRPIIKPGEQWTERFELKLADFGGTLQPLSIHAFIESDEYAYLRSNQLNIALQPRDVELHGKVVDMLGRGKRVDLRLSGKALEWHAKTDVHGSYHFDSLPPGDYQLEVGGDTGTHRIVVPKSKQYKVISAGNNLERNFIIAKPDRIAPQVTVELPWSDVVRTGQLYGLVYDERFGTGVDKVRVAVSNKVKGLWLSRNGKWVDRETWLKPNVMVSLDRFLDKRLDTVLARFPKVKRKGERNRLEKLSGMLHTRRDPLVWALKLPVPKGKGKGYASGAPFDVDADIEVRIIATDRAGHTSEAVLTNSSMHAEFLTTTSGSKQLNVEFQNLSAGVIVDYEWDFGDGERSNDQAPTHNYKVPGTYTVTLAVSGPYATDSVAKDVRVGRKQKIQKPKKIQEKSRR